MRPVMRWLAVSFLLLALLGGCARHPEPGEPQRELLVFSNAPITVSINSL